MIAIALIIVLGAAFIAGLVIYWQNIVKWIKKAVEKIKQVLGVLVQGTRTFITRTKDGLKNKSKYYNENKLTGEWEETVYERNVDVSEVPAEILAKLQAQKENVEVPTTEDLRLLLPA